MAMRKFKILYMTCKFSIFLPDNATLPSLILYLSPLNSGDLMMGLHLGLDFRTGFGHLRLKSQR